MMEPASGPTPLECLSTSPASRCKTCHQVPYPAYADTPAPVTPNALFVRSTAIKASRASRFLAGSIGIEGPFYPTFKRDAGGINLPINGTARRLAKPRVQPRELHKQRIR